MNAIFGAIGSQLLEWVLPSLAAAIAGMVMALLKKQMAKIGLDITEKQETRIKQLVHDAIVRTEEVARRDPTMTAAEKQEFTERTIRENMPELPPAEARNLIDTLLPVVRAKGISSNQGKPQTIPVHPVPSNPGTFGRKTN